MLGSGTGLHTAKTPKIKLISTYTSDFTSDVDSFIAQSVEGTLTLAANQTIDSSSGWLKGTFDTNQSGSTSGIIKSNIFSDLMKVGDRWTISAKLYLTSPSASAGEYWNGDDDVATNFVLGGIGQSKNISALEQEATVTISETDYSGRVTSAADDLRIYWALADDMPEANAVFYIKDIVAKLYRITF